MHKWKSKSARLVDSGGGEGCSGSDVVYFPLKKCLSRQPIQLYITNMIFPGEWHDGHLARPDP